MNEYNATARQTTTVGHLTVLSISPFHEDHVALRNILGVSRWTTMLKALDVLSAVPLLRQHEVSVLLCERTLAPGTWLDILERLQAMPSPPSLIVTSRNADDRLWAEALNLGAWDVLAKPFERTEVIRSVHAAWQYWHDHIKRARTAAAAG